MDGFVALVGRPNVGKSSLFNRLIGQNIAITHDTPGTTRDRKVGIAEWQSREFVILDTGGYSSSGEDGFEYDINLQVDRAVDESDLILFVVDGREGVTAEDEMVLNFLRRKGKKWLLVVNKLDTPALDYLKAEFYSFGAKGVFGVSSASGFGTGELLDFIINEVGISKPVSDEVEDSLVRVAFVGRPNVGKSTFLNTILGEQRSVVHASAGTTRDSIHTVFKGFGIECIVVDTAGIRRKSKDVDDIDFFSFLRTIKAIQAADVCVLMIDASEGITHQDLSIYGRILESGKGVVISLNKWDLLEKTHKTHDNFIKEIRGILKPMSDVPVFTVSSVNRQRLIKVLQEALQVAERRKQRIPTSLLNSKLLPILTGSPPPVYKGKTVSIKYVQQAASGTPVFLIFCNLPQYVKEPYERFVENVIRREFDFTGVPIHVFFRKK